MKGGFMNYKSILIKERDTLNTYYIDPNDTDIDSITPYKNGQFDIIMGNRILHAQATFKDYSRLAAILFKRKEI